MTFFEELKKNLTDVSGTLAKKSGEVVEVQKLKMKKYSIEGDIRKDYELMGRIFYAQMEESGEIDDNVTEIFQRIAEAKDAVAEIEDKLAKASKGKFCTTCGEKASKNMSYCPYCGAKFEDVTEAEVDEDADDAETESDETSAEVTVDEEAAETAAEASEASEASEETAAEPEAEDKAEAEAESASEDEAETSEI